MKALLPLCALLLAGCVGVKPVTLADGSQGVAISCDGTRSSISACMEKAGEICGTAGYAVLSQNGESTPVSFANGQFQATPKLATGGFSSFGGAMIRRSMFIRCNTK